MNDKSIDDDGSGKFILSHRGNYFYYNPDSKYRGLFFREKKDEDSWSMFKTLDIINTDIEITSVTNEFTSFRQSTREGSLNYSFSGEVLIIDSDMKRGNLVFTVDMRDIYDFDDKGRIYKITKESGCIIITYKKYMNSMIEDIGYTRYLAVRTDMKTEDICVWRPETYDEDRKRRSYPYNLYVYDAFRIKCSNPGRIAVAFSDEKTEAIRKAKDSFRQPEEEQGFKDPEFNVSGFSQEEKFAFYCARKSIDDLYADTWFEGYYAGLPWFHQFWARDEAVAFNALVKRGENERLKKLLMKRLGRMLDDGRIPNRFPDSMLGSADGVGMMFLAVKNMIRSLEEKGMLNSIFTSDDLVSIDKKLKFSIEKHIQSHLEGLLVVNKALETWMDTSWEGDDRAGKRIELQAAWLSMLELSCLLDNILGKQEQYRKLLEDTSAAVKSAFFENGLLKDSPDDPMQRPNIFLAYYMFPGLLDKKEWETAFEHSLEKLWLEWGGLSTISKDSRLFCRENTGEDNKSYHRGDSWFFINNIAAIAMHEINKDKFKTYIDKIKEASVQDILYKGLAGRPSELSSAARLDPAASLFQLWSASTLIELFMSIS